MNVPALIILLAAGLFMLRISGMIINDLRLPESWEAAWRFLPLTLLSALIVTGVNDGWAADTGINVIAVCVAALAAMYSRQMLIGIGSGLIVFWTLQYV